MWNHFVEENIMDNFITPYADATVEYGCAIDYNSTTDSYTLDDTIRTNNSPSVISLPITFSGHHSSVASIHNHPNEKSGAHSIGDLYTLLKFHETTDNRFTTSFVIARDGNMYALQIYDPGLASDYYSVLQNLTYNSLDTILRQSLENRYNALSQIIDRDANRDDDTFSRNTITAFALAKILEEKNTGVAMLILQDGVFKQVYARDTTYQKDGRTVEAIIREICNR
jgi:hypothetical protein